PSHRGAPRPPGAPPANPARRSKDQNAAGAGSDAGGGRPRRARTSAALRLPSLAAPAALLLVALLAAAEPAAPPIAIDASLVLDGWACDALWRGGLRAPGWRSPR